MEKLLGKHLQLRWVCSGLNGTIHTLNFKALGHGHCD